MTVEIKGYRVEIDVEDAHFVKEHGWCVRNNHPGLIYFYAKTNGQKVFLHRLIARADKGLTIDHRDKNTLNNRRNNLRFCTQSQNNYNTRMQRNNTSGFKGVTEMSGRKKKWRAQISIDRRHTSLGYFYTPEEAHEAYKVAAVRIAGEFARWE